MEHLLPFLASWSGFRAIVVGDFILDELVHGDAERLSPDAPVPVLLVRKREVRPGGAANVCMDLVGLRGGVVALGVTGADATGTRLREALAKEGIDTGGLVEDGTRPTTLKQSLIGLAQSRHPQKMFRVDEESREPVSASVEKLLLERFNLELASIDVVVIEDYAKGVCSERLCQAIIERAKRAGKPVFVDPARLGHAESLKYRGATTITPNRSEAEVATGLRTHKDNDPAHNAALAGKLLRDLDLECVVLTLDRHGALLLGKDNVPHSIATQAREVYDVSGAGDMFVAGLAAARANRCSWEDSVRFANAAAGLEVEVFGVQPIPFEQVRDSILRLAGAQQGGKLRRVDSLLAEVAEQKRRGKKVVFTNGCFDVLHSGHVTLLEQASAMGEYLVVGLNNDESVRRLKGPSRPINGEADRARVLGALASVDAVVLFGADKTGNDTPLDLIEAIKPDVLVKGADYTKDRVVGAEIVERHGGRVELVSLVEGKSTTGVIQKMRE